MIFGIIEVYNFKDIFGKVFKNISFKKTWYLYLKITLLHCTDNKIIT